MSRGQIRSNTILVVVAGTARRLRAASTMASWVLIQARTDNTNDITIGGSGVIGAEATRKGIALDKTLKNTILLKGPLDLTDVWVDSITNQDAAVFTYQEIG